MTDKVIAAGRGSHPRPAAWLNPVRVQGKEGKAMKRHLMMLMLTVWIAG
jgi:hypothetical protein